MKYIANGNYAQYTFASQICTNTREIIHISDHTNLKIRARKLYTSARIYEWKFGKGEWKLPFASPTGRVDFFLVL